MSRISDAFHKLRSEGRKALIPYITPEFPIAGATQPLLLALAAKGADLIEVGVPFSDPIADGPTIQHSSQIALTNGSTVKSVLADVRDARSQTNVPVVLMGYINPILHYGVELFMRDAVESGVDGLIVPDLLPEESQEIRTLASKYGISLVFLIAPTSSDERIRYIDSLTTDFTYCVSMTGVTGARGGFGASDKFEAFLKRVRHNTTKPFVVGFGISKAEQVERICRFADGAVVGSALIAAMTGKTTIDESVKSAVTFFSSLLQGSPSGDPIN
jgi:tryptophan synthase alpha chain